MQWWIILIIVIVTIILLGAVLYSTLIHVLTKKYFTRHSFNLTAPKKRDRKGTDTDDGFGAFMHDALKTFSEVSNERIEIKSMDGLKLVGHYYQNDNADKTVICIHGYCGSGIHDMAAIAQFFLKNGFNVLLVDNRAHGESEGNIIGYGVLDSIDIATWINTLKTSHLSKSTFIYGVSMGAATAMMTAQYVRHDEIAGIIADCGYTSIYEQFCYMMCMLTHLSPVLVAPAMRKYAKKYAGYDVKSTDTRTILAKTDIPLLLIHGDKDDFVLPIMTEQNDHACRSKHSVFIVKGAKHAEAYYIDRSEYEKRVLDFALDCTTN